MNIRSINDERSRWLRVLQRGVISQEKYDAIIDRLDEEETHLTPLALDGGDSAARQALSTPEVNPLDEADSTPPADQ